MNNKEYFGESDNIWDWTNFKSTEGFPVSEKLLDWVIGQEKALRECYLCLDEWINKLSHLKKRSWWKIWEKHDTEKFIAKNQLTAGPYLLLLGDAGTGKSLIGKALADKLTRLYKENNIELYDILCWQNKTIPTEPQISIHPSGEGKKIVRIEKIKSAKKKRFRNIIVKGVMGFLAGVAGIFLGAGTYFLYKSWEYWNIIPEGFRYQLTGYTDFTDYILSRFVAIGATTFLPAGTMFLFMIMIFAFGRFGMFNGTKGIGGAEQTDAPKLLVDNTESVAPFIDATGHKASQLFGSIAWDPYQTGGLGTPEHQRVTAGDVHRALMGILYIDEIKNLDQSEAVTLLSVLEDGQLPITLRGHGFSGGETAAMSVSTQPVPCMTFLVAAGNFDSVSLIHPALMDRILGYGKVVRMSNDMPNTVNNRRKYIQFISQEIKRFNLIPFSRDACIELINEARRRSGKALSLTTKFRPMISIIKTASTLAMNEKKEVVEDKHVLEAINEHCKSIQAQILDNMIEEENKYKDVNPKDYPKIGQVYGLSVTQDEYSGDMAGSVLAIRASMQEKGKDRNGYFNVTGVNKGGGLEGTATWVTDSIDKVRHVIIQKFGVDPAQDYLTHIDFAQELGVDGPSAGITMTLALCSILMKKKVLQDVAVTGEINIGIDGRIVITPIGGVYHKIKAAEKWGFKKVIVPKKNFLHNVKKEDYNIEVIGAETLEQYLKEILVDE